MGDMGLAGMAGAAGAGDALRTLFDQRRQAALDAQNEQYRQRALAQKDAEFRISAQEKADEKRAALEEHQQRDAELKKAQARITFAMTPVGGAVAPQDAQGMLASGVPQNLLPMTPAKPVQQTTGFMPMPSAPAQGPGMQTMQGLSPVNGPAMAQGSSTTTADPTSPLSAPAGYTRGATQQDVEKGKADALAAAKPDALVEAARLAAENRTNDNEQRAKDRLAQIAAAAAARPVSDKLVKVEHRDPATGRTVIEYLPESERRGKTFEKGASGATETRLASAQAVNQTGADIIAKLSDPAYAKVIGPALGRASKLSDFIGNPPPEFSELAGSIESYALANMGVHGMRSAQGAEQIKHLLDQHHTPESLIAAIKGLSKFSEHFMANEGRTGTTGGGTMRARDAQGVLHEAPAGTALPAGWKLEP